MRDAQGSGELEQLLAERGRELMRTAALLTGAARTVRTSSRPRWSGCYGAGGGSTTRRATYGAPCITWPPAAGGARAPGAGSSRSSGPATRPGKRT